MGASMPAQVRALLIKSAVYQRRNTGTNICLVVAPVFFCGLLLVLQVLANRLILTQRNNQCGCQCSECCVPVRVQRNWTEAELERIANGETLTPRYTRTQRCTSLDSGYCERNREATCNAYNDSNCGLRFSSPRQAIFCPIEQPSTWPPVMQTPRLSVRAGGSTTQWLPYTGSNLSAAGEVARNLVGAPELPNLQIVLDLIRTQPLSLLTLRPSQLLALVLPLLAPGGLLSTGGESIDLAQLSRLELKFGSALRSNNDYYLENAFINTNTNTSRVQLLLPEGGCQRAGIGNVTSYTVLPLPEMLLRYYNATFPLIVAPLLRLFNVTAGQLAGGLDGSQFGGITAACVDTLPRQLDNAAALDRRLYCGFGKARCDGTFFTREYGAAWNFRELGPATLRYDAYHNLSLPSDDEPVNYRIPELLNMATKAWTRTYWGNLPIVYTVRNRLMGLMSFPKYELQLKLDFSVLLGPLFYTWVVQMLLPTFLQLLVYEKEKRLRMMMKMHGLGDGAYWLVTYCWYLMLYIAYMAFFVLFGTLIRLKIFTTSSLSLQAVLYFIFGNNMLAFIFMTSSLFSSYRTATVAAFLYIFATGLIGELLLRELMQQNKPYVIAVQLLPGFALYRGLFEFSEYSLRSLFGDVPGLRWSNLRDPGNGMLGVWAILLAEWPLFMGLGWYLEQVLNSGTGASRHPLFFIRWMWRKPDADLAEIRAAHAAAALTSPPPKGGELELPTAARATREPSSPPPLPALCPVAPAAAASADDDGGDGGGDGPLRPRSVAGPVGEGFDGGGGDAAVAACAASGVGAADAVDDAEPDVSALPGRPLDRSDSDRRRHRSRGVGSSGRAGSCGGSDRGGVADGSSGGGAKSGAGSVAAEAIIVSATFAASPPRRLPSRDSRHTAGSCDSSGGGGSSRNLFVAASSPALIPSGGSPRGGSPRAVQPRSGSGSPVSVAWATAASQPAVATFATTAATAAVTTICTMSGGGAAADGSAGGGGGINTSGSGIGSGKAVLTGDMRIIVQPAGEMNLAPGSSGKAALVTTAAAAKGDDADGGEGRGCQPQFGGRGGGRVGADGATDSCRDSSVPSSYGDGGGAAAAVGLRIQAYDVAAEAERVAAMDEQQLLSTPIVVRNLAKVFATDRAGGGGGGGWLRCCGGGRGGGGPRARVAVRTLTLAIERGECFGLLGPNGAGKTTTINMLTGFLEPTGGDALVEGRSVRSRMPEIYRLMGVCPQDNLLWEQLTGEEHLLFYGRLKGLKGKQLDEAVEAGLRSVKLHVGGAGKRRVGAYSGGMKRRLSVAISFIGNPQVVYLDEPSTGLDPASRRALWDVVREHKGGRAIILTTHSMEEAEILCDRLGIFVDGQLVCIGAPREITARYAGYLVFTITVGPGHEDAARAFVAAMSPRARLTYALGGTLKYELPGEEVRLSGVFDAMVTAKREMQVLDWGVANATLEEVFIKFARQIGVETRDQ